MDHIHQRGGNRSWSRSVCNNVVSLIYYILCSAEHLIRIPSAINLIYELHYGFVLDVGMHIIVCPLVSEQTGNNHIMRIARK